MLATGQVLAQSKAVSGTVKSQQGEPLTGVTILIEGTTQGTSTDAQGAFTLQAKPDDMLAVSYLGYKSQRVKVGTRTKLEVVLTEDQNLMDEVVVVGYGTQRRRNIVGAVENISGEVLENRPNAYLLRSIQGQIPGLNITMADGKPSRSASINIRANTQSIGAGGSALCLIDGVEGDLTVRNCGMQQMAFASLSEVGGDMTLEDNCVETYQGFFWNLATDLRRIGGNLALVGNDHQNGLGGFEALVSVGGDVTVTGNGTLEGGIPVTSTSDKVGLDLLGKLYRENVFAAGATFTIESDGVTYRIDEL